VPLLGERLDATTVAFTLAVAVVIAGKRLPSGQAGRGPSDPLPANAGQRDSPAMNTPSPFKLARAPSA
jgi:hypothetical protein